jgi:hypothetical protein
MMQSVQLDKMTVRQPTVQIMLENDAGEFRIPLEYACQKCGGAFVQGEFGKRVPCEECRGTGAVLTGQGMRLLQWFKKWSQIPNPVEKATECPLCQKVIEVGAKVDYMAPVGGARIPVHVECLKKKAVA